jgi:hypothetical protein
VRRSEIWANSDQPRVLTKVEHAVKVKPVGEFELKGIRRPLAAYLYWRLPRSNPEKRDRRYSKAVTTSNPSRPLHHLKLILLHGVMFGRLRTRIRDRGHSSHDNAGLVPG